MNAAENNMVFWSFYLFCQFQSMFVLGAGAAETDDIGIACGTDNCVIGVIKTGIKFYIQISPNRIFSR